YEEHNGNVPSPPVEPVTSPPPPVPTPTLSSASVVTSGALAVPTLAVPRPRERAAATAPAASPTAVLTQHEVAPWETCEIRLRSGIPRASACCPGADRRARRAAPA